MHAPNILTRTPSTLTARLELFSKQVRNSPAHDDALNTWNHLERQLPLEYQARILRAWNKHLAGANEPEEIVSTVETIIKELRA